MLKRRLFRDIADFGWFPKAEPVIDDMIFFKHRLVSLPNI